MSWPTFETLQLARDGPVTWLRFNRPARLNALIEQSFDELGKALCVVRDDAVTRVLVLTGNGRGFCSGSDVEGLRDRFGWSAPQQMKRFDEMGRHVVLALYHLPVPTIAAINGPAAGGGLSLALACDIRVASEAAAIRFGYTAIGLIPDLGATYFLPRVIGLSRSCRLLWTNARLTATEALGTGLVDEVTPASEFPARVATLAASIAAAPALAVRLGRAALRGAADATLEQALDGEAVAQSVCLQSGDHRERVSAFLARRGSTARGPAAMRAE